MNCLNDLQHIQATSKTTDKAKIATVLAVSNLLFKESSTLEVTDVMLSAVTCFPAKTLMFILPDVARQHTDSNDTYQLHK